MKLISKPPIVAAVGMLFGCIRRSTAREIAGLARRPARKTALAALGIATLTLTPPASADPTPGHDAKVNTQTPQMLCEIGSDDADPGIGPNVTCQRGSFLQAPADADRPWSPHRASSATAMRTSASATRTPPLTPGARPDLPHPGWTIVAGGDGIRFNNDGTGHGMFIGSDTRVNPF